MKSKAEAPKKQGAAVPARAQEDSPTQRDVATLPSRQSKAVAEAKERYSARRPRFAVKVDPSSASVMKLTPDFGGSECHHVRQLDAFGTASHDFAGLAVSRLAAIARHRGADLPTEAELNAALAAVDGMNPESEVEAMLAMEMYATHDLAMEMLTRAKQATTSEAMQNCSSIGIKLLRTYTAQIEALAKLRRGGEQKVRVEHVHVYPGGQAIVGNVTTQRGEDGKENRGQPHEDPGSYVLSPRSPLWSEDPERHAMPEGTSERED